MNRKNRIVEILRSALGANDNPGERASPIVIIIGSLDIVFVKKKQDPWDNDNPARRE